MNMTKSEQLRTKNLFSPDRYRSNRSGGSGEKHRRTVLFFRAAAIFIFFT
jgi:hypothetical protein